MPHSISNGNPADDSFESVSPIDVGRANSNFNESHPPAERPGSVQSPRSARFAEATSVVSPVDPPARSPFADPQSNNMTGSAPNNTSAPDVSDVGFGYVADNRASRHATFPDASQDSALHSNPPGSPLKSALKSPGTPGRNANPLSPTFREEQILEHHEKDAARKNEKDVKIKTRVRISKMFLRGINFSCALIIMVLIAQSFVIFNATKNLASRNSMSAWDPDTNLWPQILVLVVASITLLLSVGVFYGYARGGHRRAEKVGVYYTIFAVFTFATTLVVWVVLAAIFQNSKNGDGGSAMWGWACKDNTRAVLFGEDVDYELVCRLQDWVLICIIIEIIVDTITIAIYAVLFYRFYSKRKLRKSMDTRDKARSDLYLAHLRSQTAPNTPGFPHSPRSPSSPEMKHNAYSAAENGQSPSMQYATPQSPASALTTSRRPFQLQAPPGRTHDHSAPTSTRGSVAPMSPGFAPRVNEHVGAAPGEKTYESVPIPGSGNGNETMGTAVTTDKYVESGASRWA